MIPCPNSVYIQGDFKASKSEKIPREITALEMTPNSFYPGDHRSFKKKCYNLLNLNISNWLREKLSEHTGDLFRALLQLRCKKKQHIKQTQKFLNQIACLAKLPNRSRGSFVLRTECLLNWCLTLTQSVEQSN